MPQCFVHCGFILGEPMVDKRFYQTSDDSSLKELLIKAGLKDLVPVSGNIDLQISGANELENALPSEISLGANRKYLKALKQTQAGCVIVHKAIAQSVPKGTVAIIANDPHLAFVKILNEIYLQGTALYKLRQKNIIEPKLEKNVIVSKGVIFGSNVEIGEGSYIGANVSIGNGVAIGRNCIIEANVSIEYAYLGDEVHIHSGARIGSEGFGWLDIAQSNIKIPQLGRVIIQDKVEIGANSTIDRGALGDTTIGEGTKIDNLVQIGHNCQIGSYCLIAATSGISGSTIIGNNCLLGGGVGTSGHISIGAKSIVHGRAAVTKDWPEGSRIIGAPAQETKSFWREMAALRNLGKGKNNGAN